MAAEEIIAQTVKMRSQEAQLQPLDTGLAQEQQIQGIEPNESSLKFAHLMEQNRHLLAQNSPLVAARPTPIEQASRLGGTLSIEEAKNLSVNLTELRNRQQARMQGIMDRLANGSELRPSVRQLLDSKINTLNNQFNTISTELKLPPLDEVSYNDNNFLTSLKIGDGELIKPVEKFFNFIVRGEKQLYTLESEIDAAFAGGDSIPNPGVMLKLQLKMTHVSQQLELFTSMLNKGLESSKTVFNTQI